MFDKSSERGEESVPKRLAMATMGTNPMCGGGFMIRREEGNIFQSRVSRGALQGWRKHLSWRLEPEVVWCRHLSLKPTKCNTIRLVVAANTQDSQNVDLPPVFAKRRKRPSVLPKQIRKKRLPATFEDPSLQAPANGLLVEPLIPVAHDVMQAKAIATKGVRLLLGELPVLACRYCTETHIGPVGHTVRTCLGPKSSSRNSAHDWVKGTIDDILVRRDAYHLADRLARPLSHEQRFDVERIDAVEELCIQAGVEVPEYPTKRYTEPVEPSTRRKRQDAHWMGGVRFTFYTNEGSYIYTDPLKKLGGKDPSRVGPDDGVDTQADDSEVLETVSKDRDASVYRQQKITNRSGQHDTADTQIDDSRESQAELIEPMVDINSEDDLQTIAQKTLQAWERMREGCKKLIIKYRVVACGYCAEIHAGPRGHRAKACGAFKHQWRDGKHGWQDASIDDLIPPQYVWHVRDRSGPPLENALKRYYGKAPAIVELCIQAGAPVPENHKPLMRLDIAIPTLAEIENVI